MAQVGDVIDYEGARWLVLHVTPGLTVTTPRGRRETPGHLGIRRLTSFELLAEQLAGTGPEMSVEEAARILRRR
jgi:hypothetical protein